MTDTKAANAAENVRALAVTDQDDFRENADLLIETEAELRKVYWPTLEESINGSWTVLLTVVFLMAFLAGADYVLGEVSRVILTGSR